MNNEFEINLAILNVILGDTLVVRSAQILNYTIELLADVMLIAFELRAMPSTWILDYNTIRFCLYSIQALFTCIIPVLFYLLVVHFQRSRH